MDQLARRLLDLARVDLSPHDPEYPTQILRGAADFGREVGAVDVAQLVAAQQSEYDRDTQTEYSLRELLWLARWQTRELCHAAREIESLRRQLDAALVYARGTA